MAVSPRFGLDDILSNEVVDFQVLDSNFDIMDAGAAHLSLANSYGQVQSITRPAAGNPALTVQVSGDATPRLAVYADGSLNWPGGSIAYAGSALTVTAATLNTTRLLTAAGTAAAPSFAFTTDQGTGLYSPSAGTLGVSVGGAQVLSLSNVGEIRFNRTNARILAYTSDDPATPGERLMQINALTVTPGRLYAASLTVNGASQINGSETITGNLQVNGTANVNSTLQTSGWINAYGGRVNFEGSNVVYIAWRGDLGALYIPYGNGIYTSGITNTGNMSVSGQVNIGGRLITAGYDAGWQNNFGGNSILNGQVNVNGRFVAGGYDAGWQNNFGGNVITNSYFYQRGDGGARCYDVRDFSYTPANAGNTLVQRDGNGAFSAGNCTFYGASIAGDLTCSATFYVRWGGTTTFQVAAGNGEVFCNADGHFANVRAFYQVAAYNSYNGAPGGGNQNAFLAPNNGDWSGQGLANQWRTWSTIRFKRNIEPLRNALALVRHPALHGVSYDNVDQVPNGKTWEPSGTLTRQVGFVADDWLEHVPEIVGVDDEGKAVSMDYSRVGAVLWEAFKEYIAEADARIADLTARLALLEGRA
jgi:hypothetical protein